MEIERQYQVNMNKAYLEIILGEDFTEDKLTRKLEDKRWYYFRREYLKAKYPETYLAKFVIYGLNN